MKTSTENEQKNIEQKLKKIKLDLDNIPNIFNIKEKITYKPSQRYDNTNYKIYHYIDASSIEIYITPGTKLYETSKKYKLAEPLINYLQPNDEESSKKHEEFLEMLKNLDLERLEKISKEQKELQKKEAFVTEKNEIANWAIYYSEKDDKYFMMFPTKEKQNEALFFLIKKQIELKKTRKKEMIYVPISNMQYTGEILKKSEIADLENFLWYFTKQWPKIYEVVEKDGSTSLKIIGNMQVYERIKSFYKMNFTSREQAMKFFKVIEVVFNLKSNAEDEFDFEIGLNENGEICFYFNHIKLTNGNLNSFIKREVQVKTQKAKTINNKKMMYVERLELLKEIIAKQNLEYLAKEKQIVTFLECKKTFFGKLSYFFKSKKKNKDETVNKKDIQTQKIIEENEEENFDEKEIYSVEALINICEKLQKGERELKDKKIQIKTLENRKENLARKIKNATIYINEIESHKKSIFDFWKFTNKDEQPLLIEADEQEVEENEENSKEDFSYENEIQELAEIVDLKQRNIFLNIECDAIFATYQDIDSFIIDRKEKILKKDEKIIEKNLSEMQLEYEHREKEKTQKNKFKILGINEKTSVKQYMGNIHKYGMILQEAYDKMKSPSDIKVYKVEKNDNIDKNLIIANMDIENEIEKFYNKKCESFVLNCIKIKKDMQAIFYSNIMFCKNLEDMTNAGMDESKCVLLDLSRFEMKLVGRRDFNINIQKNQFENEIKLVQVYEYEIENIEK